VIASMKRESSSLVTPRSTVTRSTPPCCNRRISGPSVSAFAIGMSSTITSSPTIPITTAGWRLWSSWKALDSDSRLRAMIGCPGE
jgi:hypothetical protein